MAGTHSRDNGDSNEFRKKQKDKAWNWLLPQTPTDSHEHLVRIADGLINTYYLEPHVAGRLLSERLALLDVIKDPTARAIAVGDALNAVARRDRQHEAVLTGNAPIPGLSIAGYLKSIPVNGPDPEHQIYVFTETLMRRYAVSRQDAVRLMLLHYQPRMRDPAPDHVFEDAATEAAAKIKAQPPPSAAARTPAKLHEPPRFEFINASEFANGDYRPNWFIKKVLTRGEPGVIAGPSKSLKTAVTIDMGVSLAAGVPFLNTFDVPHKARVAIISGESGPATLRETALRICAAKGVRLQDLADNLNFCFTLPTFSDVASMKRLIEDMERIRPEVAVIDPTYLSLGDVEASNMFQMGAAFRTVAEFLLSIGSTPLLVHHANRQLKVGDQMELTHLAYTGLEQFARQYIFLNRMLRYAHDGTHDLWLGIGGSAGHGGQHMLHIEEGVVQDDFSGRKWGVSIINPADVQADKLAEKELAKQRAFDVKVKKQDALVFDAIDAEIAGGQPACTKNVLKTKTRLNTGTLNEVLKRLEEEGAIELTDFEKQVGNGAKKELSGYRRVKKCTQEQIPDCE